MESVYGTVNRDRAVAADVLHTATPWVVHQSGAYSSLRWPISFRGLHLRDLQKMGILTEVPARVDDGRCELVMRRRASGASARSRGRCGGPSALVPSSVVVARSPRP
jgi:hypothetical protein